MRLSVVISVVMVHGDVRHFEEAKGYELYSEQRVGEIDNYYGIGYNTPVLLRVLQLPESGLFFAKVQKNIVHSEWCSGQLLMEDNNMIHRSFVSAYTNRSMSQIAIAAIPATTSTKTKICHLSLGSSLVNDRLACFDRSDT
jgi:hypothetical protein